eukprot:GHVN01064937.1.p1 GENE.GHVN01064937.1~~GHVN01064937.1.p1  ORF type:complete len:629 (+),score=102.16 GHVN01064937.1:59-1888(+)
MDGPGSWRRGEGVGSGGRRETQKNWERKGHMKQQVKRKLLPVVGLLKDIMNKERDEDLGKLIKQYQNMWLDGWTMGSEGSFCVEDSKLMIETLARIPEQETDVPCPHPSLIAKTLEIMIRGQGEKEKRQTPALTLRLIERLLKLSWSCSAEDVEANLSYMIKLIQPLVSIVDDEGAQQIMAIVSLSRQIRTPFSIKTKRDHNNSLCDEPSTSSSTPSATSITIPSFLHWPIATVAWLMNCELFCPQLLPRMLNSEDGTTGLYRSSDQWFHTVLKLFIGSSFREGFASLTPKCVADGVRGGPCDECLIPSALISSDEELQCVCHRNGCDRPLKYLCQRHGDMHIEGGLCELHFTRRRRQLGGDEAQDVYNGIIGRVKPNGAIEVVHTTPRKQPNHLIDWRTTERLSTCNLVGVVPLPKWGAPLELQDRVFWFQSSIHPNAKQFGDEKLKANGTVFLEPLAGSFHRVSVKWAEVYGSHERPNVRPGENVGLIDCKTFVPDVMNAIIRHTETFLEGGKLPFENGKLLKIGDGKTDEMMSREAEIQLKIAEDTHGVSSHSFPLTEWKIAEDRRRTLTEDTHKEEREIDEDDDDEKDDDDDENLEKMTSRHCGR